MLKKFQKYIYPKSRIEAFSDGVFAIIITLLILEIRIPVLKKDGTVRDAIHELWELRAMIIGWGISFIMVGVGWLQHHNLLHMAKKIDLAIIWFNLLVLMAFCLVPFTAGFMGENSFNAVAIASFGIELGAAALMLCIMYWYIAKYQLKENYEGKEVRRNVFKSMIAGPMLYTLAGLSAFIHPLIAYTLYALLPFAFLFPMDKEIFNEE
jgi:uncharacterized membrane protein